MMIPYNFFHVQTFSGQSTCVSLRKSCVTILEPIPFSVIEVQPHKPSSQIKYNLQKTLNNKEQAYEPTGKVKANKNKHHGTSELISMASKTTQIRLPPPGAAAGMILCVLELKANSPPLPPHIPHTRTYRSIDLLDKCTLPHNIRA